MRRSPSLSSSDDDDPPAERSARRVACASEDEASEDLSASPSGSEGEEEEEREASPHALPAFLGGGRPAASLPLGLRAAAAAATGRPARWPAPRPVADDEDEEPSASSDDDDDAPPSKRHARANKNRPTVAPAHARPPKVREVIGLPTGLLRPPGRDPRFDDLAAERKAPRGSKTARRAAAAAAGGGAAGAAAAGGFDERARKRYAFLFEQTLPAEKKELSRSLRKAKAPEARAALAARLTQVSQALATDSAARAAAAAAAARRAKERAAVAAGKKPFYQKPAAARKEALIAKFETLKASGKLEAAMAKRRKKNAAKAHRHMPYRREG